MPISIARLLLVALLLIAQVGTASAATPPSCADWPDQAFCVVIPNVHTAPGGNYIEGTAYLMSNESPSVLNGMQTVYDAANNPFDFEPVIPVPVGVSRVTYLEQWAERGIVAGTLAITGTQIFSVQVIDPLLGGCRNTTDLTCMTVYVPAGGVQYSVFNTESKPFLFEHDIYRDGVFVSRETHSIAGFERVTYQLPVAPGGARVTNRSSYRIEVHPPEPKRLFIPLVGR